MVKEDQDRFSKFFIPGSHKARPVEKRFRPVFLGLISIFGFTFSLTCLFLAMRGIMRLGGFVAHGGPYVIAHPAPNYVWIFPVSIWTGMIFFFINLYFSNQIGGMNLMVLAWPATFISLGWNFLEFAFRPPGGGLAWGWLICGVVFFLMGGLPLLLILKPLLRKPRPWKIEVSSQLNDEVVQSQNQKIGLMYFVLQLAFIALAIYSANIFFKAISN